MNIERLVNEVEDMAAIVGKLSHEIPAATIGDLILEKLAVLDKVAYIRFASVYRHFEDLDEFVREIKKIDGKSQKKEGKNS